MMDGHAQHRDDMFATNQIERMLELMEQLRQPDGAGKGRETRAKDGERETETGGKEEKEKMAQHMERQMEK